MTFEKFEKLAKAKSIVPLFRKLNADFVTPVIAYLKMRESGTQSFLLESVAKGEQIGRYTFIGQQPFRVVTAAGGLTVVNEFNSNRAMQKNFIDSFMICMFCKNRI